MKKLLRKFIKRNTASILSKFHTMIDELEAVAKHSDNRAAEAADRAYIATCEHEEHKDEADRARSAAAKVKGVFGI